jgi:hypothetical protein
MQMTKQPSRRPCLQFSLRSLLLVMLVTAAFFGGRMSLRPELERMRLVEVETRRAQEAALQAAEQARYMAELARAQAVFAEAMHEEASEEQVSDSSELGVPDRDAVPHN